MDTVFFIIYGALGYWAAGKTIYANKIRIGTFKDLFLTRFVVGILLGYILIPVAIIKSIFFR